MKKNFDVILNIFLLCCILFGALFLRAFYLKNTLGLTFIELNLYQDIFNPKDIGAWKNVIHGNPVFSLYNVILSFWSTFISDKTIYLRALSVIFGVITCFFAYFAEKRIQGFLCLILFSLNSFLINYSQEVGMYSLLGIFATLNIVSLIKIKTIDKMFTLWVVSVIGMILTSLPTIIFIISEIAIFGLYQRKKKFFLFSLISMLLSLPYFAYVVFNYRKYADLFIGTNYDYANVFGFVQNFFTPKLIELNLSNYVHYFQTLFMEINFYSLGFIFIPIAISLYFIVNAFIKNRFSIILFLIGLLYIILRIIIQMFFGIPFLTGEYIAILPIFLIIMTYGFEKNTVSISLLSILLLLNSIFLISQENSAFKNKRIGTLDFSRIINKTVKDKDIVLTWIKFNDIDDFIKAKNIKFYNMTDIYINKSSLITDNKTSYEKFNSKEKKDFLRTKFIKREYPESTLIETNVLFGNLNDNNRLYIVYPKQYNYEYNDFLDMVSKDHLYYKHNENDLILYHTIVQLKIMLQNNFIKQEERNHFVVNIYKK